MIVKLSDRLNKAELTLFAGLAVLHYKAAKAQEISDENARQIARRHLVVYALTAANIETEFDMKSDKFRAYELQVGPILDPLISTSIELYQDLNDN